MAVFSILFWLVVLCTGVVLVWAILSAIGLLIFRRKAHVILCALPLSFLLVIGYIAVNLKIQSSPRHIFKNEFGISPPSDTTIVDAHSFALGDSGRAHIHFKTSQATINRIVAGGFASGDSDVLFGGDVPKWYRPLMTSTTQVYHCSSRGFNVTGTPTNASFASEFRRLYFDPSTGDAWYEFGGID